MKTTNHKHIIKEKLEGVDLPDMDKAWTKMESQLDVVGNPVVHGISQFVGKYKIYLNIFIAALTIGAIGLYVKSKTYDQTTTARNNTGETKQGLTFEFAKMNTTDASLVHNAHEYLAEVPEKVISENTPVKPLKNWNHKTSTKNKVKAEPVSIDNDEVVVLDEDLNLPPTEDSVVQEEQDTVPVVIVDALAAGRDNWFEEPKITIQNKVGVKLQTSLVPEFSLGNSIRNTGVSVFTRHYLTRATAIQLELGYNPVAIRPLTYKETYTIFNNFNYSQTDSSTVTSLQYVSIPLNLYHHLSENISVSFGPQVSFLTGLKGNNTQILTYPGATEEPQTSENIQIKNRGGFKPTDFGLNAEFNVAFKKRFEAGMRFQVGFSDYTTTKIDNKYTQTYALQLKLACILNK